MAVIFRETRNVRTRGNMTKRSQQGIDTVFGLNRRFGILAILECAQ